MGVLNRARKEIYRNVWIHYFVFKDNERTKKRVGHSYGNLRVFLIPFAYWWRDAYSSEDRRRNVEFGSTTYSDTLWWQEKCALRCPGTVYLLSLPSLTATQGFQFFESERQCSTSSFSPETLTKVKTLDSQSAEELTDSLLWLQDLMPDPNFLVAQEGAINTEFDRQNSFFKNADI